MKKPTFELENILRTALDRSDDDPMLRPTVCRVFFNHAMRALEDERRYAASALSAYGDECYQDGLQRGRNEQSRANQDDWNGRMRLWAAELRRELATFEIGKCLDAMLDEFDSLDRENQGINKE
jgi:hypothetical protein